MERVQIWDKVFEKSLTVGQIQTAICEMAKKMKNDLQGKEALFICILNGAFMFASDLMKELELNDSEITFLKIASYSGTRSDGITRELIGLDRSLEGRTVVILEDIVDSGLTMEGVIKSVLIKGAKEVKIATMLFKPEAIKADIVIDYLGITIKNDFVVGYGLDYNGRGRNFKNIYTLVS